MDHTTNFVETAEETIEELAERLRPEWFGESGQILSNYPGQDEYYQNKTKDQIREILKNVRNNFSL